MSFQVTIVDINNQDSGVAVERIYLEDVLMADGYLIEYDDPDHKAKSWVTFETEAEAIFFQLKYL